MNNIDTSETNQHDAVLLLLPWYLKNSLEAGEQQQVEQHLRTCLLCRRELIFLNKVDIAVQKSTAIDLAAAASFANVRSKLQAVEQKQTPLAASEGKREKNSCKAAQSQLPSWFSGCFGRLGKPLELVAALLLAVLPLTLQERDTWPTTGYYTLSAEQPEQALGTKLHVVFAKNLPETSIDEVLAGIHGELISEANSAGAYTVQLSVAKDSPDAAAAITFLRSRKDVLLAEPMVEP